MKIPTESFKRFDSDSSAELRLKVVLEAFKNGLRLSNLGPQPAPWVKRSLEYLEAGKSLSANDIRRFDKEGGTDHPDPWFNA
ncbi:MAG: hypothetical protein AB1721_02620 [Patescibacteria group bacterium]